METTNAEITGTHLGAEDHGILTAYLHCAFEDRLSQSFGGYALDSYDSEKKERVGVSFGMEFVRQVLETVGVSRWEDLKGKHIRLARAEGWNGTIEGIGHITKNKWFYPRKLAEEMRK